MKKIQFLVVSLLLFISTFNLGQTPEWLNYTNGNFINTIAEEAKYLWIGTDGGGLIRYGKDSEQLTFYNRANSGLPSNRILSIQIDSSGNKWIGTWNGLVKFDN